MKQNLKEYILKSGLGILLKKKSYTIVQNSSDNEFLVANKITNHEHIFFIKGVGVAVQPSKEILIKNNFNVLFAGRMLWSKGVKEIIETAKLFELDGNNSITFLLAGKPDEQNPEAIPLSYLEQLKNSKNILWLDHVEDMTKVYQDTDIFLFPTKYGEGVPKALLEAASFGIPIICSDNPGCKEVVKNNYNGIVLKNLGPQEIKNNIIMLCNDIEKENLCQ
ncbi:MAG: glycosyltransferase [Ignavibacteriae bacterium]|nr:glycosyltransferase [Ignavibacteriota bacterium]